MALARGIKVLDQARIARVDRARYGRLPVEILISMMPWRSGVAPVTRLVSAIRVSLGETVRCLASTAPRRWSLTSFGVNDGLTRSGRSPSNSTMRTRFRIGRSNM